MNDLPTYNGMPPLTPHKSEAMTKRAMSIASFCAMTCNEGGFHVFLSEEFDGIWPKITSATQATEVVKTHCGIESRSELNIESLEQQAWLELQAKYKDWLRC
jgi:hypothetical protein